MRHLVEREIDPAALLAEMDSDYAGAVVTFEGRARRSSTVSSRSVTALLYEAYPELAEPVLEKIEDEVRRDAGVLVLRILHRVGRVPLGGTTVLIVAAAAHRAEAFAACRRALERVKAEAPIWKKELYDEGSAWIEPAEPREREVAP